MKVLYQSDNWMYCLLHDEKTNQYFLDVVCGGIAMYSVALRLWQQEAAFLQSRVAQSQTAEIDALAEQVRRRSPRQLAGREMFFSGPEPWRKFA